MLPFITRQFIIDFIEPEPFLSGFYLNTVNVLLDDIFLEWIRPSFQAERSLFCHLQVKDTWTCIASPSSLPLFPIFLKSYQVMTNMLGGTNRTWESTVLLPWIQISRLDTVLMHHMAWKRIWRASNSQHRWFKWFKWLNWLSSNPNHNRSVLRPTWPTAF